MVARFHYGPRVYRQFLDDKLADAQQKEVNSHVEDCTECQVQLEAMLQDDVSWDDIPDLLNPDEKKQGSRIANGKQTGTSRRPEFLAKSDQPNSLGRFGRYEIVEVLGCGGMGVVMKGFDPALHRFSAIKVLAPVLATSASARQRFAREAKSAAAVVHEHVVPIQTIDEENGLPYLVMPVVDGHSLQQRVEETGLLEVKEVLRIGMQIASGLAAAHAQGLVHRDIKPANVLLEHGVERVMLTDFGLARAADDANMTQTGVLAGTPQYMSPEQARGADVDHRSDLFSLGSVLYFMCTGRSPFRAETTMGVLHRITNDDPRPVRGVNADIPQWLQDIIHRLLSKDKDLRFQTATEVADVLSKWLAYLQQPDVATKPQEPKASRVSRLSGNFNGRAKQWSVMFAGFLFVLAGILITVELNKGTLTIECGKDGVPIRIMKDDEVYRKLTVDRGKNSTKISAGEYVVEIDGPADGLDVEDGAIVLSRRGAALARIVHAESETVKQAINDRAAAPIAGEAVKRKHRADETSGPVQVEFIEGKAIDEDVFVVRGRKDDVERVISKVRLIEETAEQTGRAGKGQLRLAFRNTPWSDVLAWIARQTDSSISQDTIPTGTFTFEDSSRTYAPLEAFDVINEALYRRGYNLIRREKRMYLVDFEDGLDKRRVQDLLVDTPQEDLDSIGEFQLATCRFDVAPSDISSIGEDVKRLLGSHGSMVVLPTAKQLVVVDIGRNLRSIRSAITKVGGEKQTNGNLATVPLDDAGNADRGRLMFRGVVESSTGQGRTRQSPRVRLSVDESRIGSIHVGQTATVTIDAFPETTYAGRVTAIRRPNDEQTKHEVIVLLETWPESLKRKLTATIEVIDGP